MNILTLAELREKNIERSTAWENPDRRWTPADRMVELVGELGEAANVMKKMQRLEDGMTNGPEGKSYVEYRVQLVQEVGDVAICLDLLCMTLGIDLGVAVRNKFNLTSDKIGSDVKL